MYAIIETGGKQVRVSEGSVIYVERLDVEAGSAYTFDKVLMLGGESVNIGNPYHGSGSVKSDIQKKDDSTKLWANVGFDPSIIRRKSDAK